jgi:hypothetical protein
VGTVGGGFQGGSTLGEGFGDQGGENTEGTGFGDPEETVILAIAKKDENCDRGLKPLDSKI